MERTGAEISVPESGADGGVNTPTKCYSVDEISRMLNKQARYSSERISRAVADGFRPWHLWNRSLEKDDEVRQFGMIVFWKPKDGVWI